MVLLNLFACFTSDARFRNTAGPRPKVPANRDDGHAIVTVSSR